MPPVAENTKGMNVTICGLEGECLTREWLQVQFSMDAMAHLAQVCCQSPDLIVPNESEAATRAG